MLPFSLRPRALLLLVSLSVAALGAACGSSGDGSTFQPPGPDGSTSDGSDDSTLPPDDGGIVFDTSTGDATSDATQGFDVQPATLQTITVPIGQTTPTVAYTATLNGHPINAAWSLDRGDLGSVLAGPANTTTFTPKGTTGGLVTVVAGLNGMTLKRQIFVKLTGTQNGPNGSPAEQGQIPATVGALTAGGGVGGVGGEGLGPAVTDPATLTALGTPVGNGQTQNLKFLYPYDKTVFPRGMLAPLVMWDWSTGDADAIQIHLETTSGSFSWTGTFARPAILQQTMGKFVRHPIPQDVWDTATNTAGGPTANMMTDRLVISVTVARGGMGYGPISETWTIAPARLSGIIYYNSYGTQLAQNYTGAVGGNGKFGGAVLSIHVGDTAPKLTAGANGGVAQCRVCHSVASGGSRLMVQHGDTYSASSAYDLTPTSSTEVPLPRGATFPAMYPDGSKALSPNGQLLSLPSANLLTATGLSTVATDLGAPAFSPDGKLVVFNPMAGPGFTNPTQKLVVMNFDNTNNAFTGQTVVVDDTGQPAQTRPGWPAFLPDAKSVVFHHQTAAGLDGNTEGQMSTRKGAKAQIHWTNVGNASMVTPLDQLNGKGYLPKLASAITMSCTADGSQVGNVDADHGDDVDLNYEPTVNPVASGGYAWVVFTSRRMYGNEAVIPPYCSDPRGVDLIQNITTKKLWVAAIDLGALPGTDASHPAFYLPAQELLAGNSRGFWVLDPCRPDGTACSTGDQCCNGYCQAGDGGTLVCSNTPPNTMCSQPQEKCVTTSDCCDPQDTCVGGFCTLAGPH